MDLDGAGERGFIMNAPLLPRFSIAARPGADHLAYVEGGELRHMRQVLRLAPGDAVVLFDPDGSEHRGAIESYEIARAVVRVETSAPARYDPALIVAAAIVKGPRMDYLVEKVAELGATDICPILCARGLVKSPGEERLARWRRLAIAAAKQSHSPRPVEVHPPREFADLIRTRPADTLAVICTPGCEPLGDLIRQMRPRAILIAVGPEGDFDEAERNAAVQAGFVTAGLGANRLRSETAAIAAASIANDARRARGDQ
jgi:16S rRNA (uracil1498-N3)-methyltransferase